MLAKLWHSPSVPDDGSPGDPVGTACIGSSEAIMLGGEPELEPELGMLTCSVLSFSKAYQCEAAPWYCCLPDAPSWRLAGVPAALPGWRLRPAGQGRVPSPALGAHSNFWAAPPCPLCSPEPEKALAGVPGEAGQGHGKAQPGHGGAG